MTACKKTQITVVLLMFSPHHRTLFREKQLLLVETNTVFSCIYHYSYSSLEPFWSLLATVCNMFASLCLSGDKCCAEGGQQGSGAHTLETAGQRGLGPELQHRTGTGQWLSLH